MSFFRSLLPASRRRPASRPPATAPPPPPPEIGNADQSTPTPAAAKAEQPSPLPSPPSLSTNETNTAKNRPQSSSPAATAPPKKAEPPRPSPAPPSSSSTQSTKDETSVNKIRPQSLSPAARSPPSSASSSRRMPQSRSPPPRTLSPRPRSVPSSPSRAPSAPKKASPLRSPKQTSSDSPKSAKSPKEPKTSSQDIPGDIKTKLESSSNPEEIKEVKEINNGQITESRADATAIDEKTEVPKPAGVAEIRDPMHKDIRDDIKTLVNRVGDPKFAAPDHPVSVITLAGENRGAVMQMGPNSSEGLVPIRRGYKIDQSNDEKNKNDDDKNEANANRNRPEAYVNNNVQAINNTIVVNTSITERNPGVHMAMAQLIAKEPKPSTETVQKAEFNVARPEKLTYEPRVRRRCLRGLLVESSDSDPENPRRHGCRVGGGGGGGSGGRRSCARDDDGSS
ncbi:uncharacterized protein LOC127257229 [Andrographis paniculata]|uniref:uncharacterized protein LOC127257229 n=1 Tax=Andrographis paniculata TaxID=175694 RepID=UPI0021E9A4BE|nr:uncharacterized protein LOC127257229 [Andrographis paniculata]